MTAGSAAEAIVLEIWRVSYSKRLGEKRGKKKQLLRNNNTKNEYERTMNAIPNL